MKTKYAAANWKMNLKMLDALALSNKINTYVKDNQPQNHVILSVPFPYIPTIKSLIKDTPHLSIAAQNCYHKSAGAFTGEVSAEILASINTDFVIVGHSERREYFNETNSTIAAKIDLILQQNLKVIFCCGEPLAVRESNAQAAFVEQQISEGIFHLSAQQIKNLVIAYEPIWAIGTGKTANNEQIEETHTIIRQFIQKKYGVETANEISILYGGSVKANNAKEIFNCPSVDGALVGGASLIDTEFIEIIKAL